MELTDKGGCNGNLASMWKDSIMWGQKYLAKNKNELPPRVRITLCVETVILS